MKKETIYQIVATVVMAALLCLSGLVSIPVAGTSVALVSLVVYVGAFLIGPLGSSVAVVIYYLIGLAGLPVFSNAGGIEFVKGNLGFFPVGLLFIAFITSVYVRKTRACIWKSALAVLVSTVIFYLVGMLRWVWVERSYMSVAFVELVKNQILFDVIKMAAGIAIGKVARTALVKAGLIVELPEEEKKAEEKKA